MSIHREYRTFLLTVWQEDEQSWRFLLEDPRSGTRRGFTSINALIDGLMETIDAKPDTSDGPVSDQPSEC